MNDTLTDSEQLPRPRRRPWGWVFGLLVLVALAAAGWYGWQRWQAWRTQQQDAAREQISALEERLEALRQDQRAQGERLQDAAATNRVLRDEVLGLSQRGALLEDSVAKLADSTRQGAAALRLDQTELELHLAAQRLSIAGDVAGAREAYALAADTLEGVDDPRLLNVKQALEQERAAVLRLGAGPHAQVEVRLTRASQALSKLPQKVVDDPATRPAWQRILAPVIDVRPSGSHVAVAPAQRAAFENALQLELTLARAALERNDRPAFQASVQRAASWLPRLWPNSPQADALEKEFSQIAALPLQPALPELGSTLTQLQAFRGKPAAPPLPAAPAADPAPSTGEDTTP